MAKPGKALIAYLVLAIAAVFISASLLTSPAEEYTNHLNYSRRIAGLWGVCTDGVLAEAAQEQAQRMANAGFVFHSVNLSGQLPDGWSVVGENVGFGPDLATLHRAFLASPIHAANIYKAAHTHVGVGVVDSGGLWVAVIFMGNPTRGCGWWW